MNIEDIKKLRALAVAADQPHSGVARDYFRQSVTAPRMLTLLDLAERQLNFFQQRVQPWMLACFGEMIAGDREERNHRFLEEALELVQSTGCTASEAHQLVDYVYGRSVGEPAQEVGGVMVTLAALCLANGLDMHAAAETELARIWTKVEQIRAKQAAKPKHSPLPEPAPKQHAQDGGAESAVFMRNSEISPLGKGDSGGAYSRVTGNAQAAQPFASGAMQAMADAGLDVSVGGEKVQPRGVTQDAQAALSDAHIHAIIDAMPDSDFDPTIAIGEITALFNDDNGEDEEVLDSIKAYAKIVAFRAILATWKSTPAIAHNKHCGCPNCCEAAPVATAVVHGDVVTYVPIHPRTGEPLWASTIPSLERQHPQYEMRPLRYAAQPQADAAPVWDTDATKRLRSIVDMLGMKSCMPDGDLTGYEFTVLGFVRMEIERMKAAVQPFTAQGDVLSREAGEDIGCMREQATAWHAVHNALTEVCPGWHNSEAATTGIERAVTTVKALAQRAANQPDSERDAVPTAQRERAWYKDWLAGLDGNITVDQVEFGRRVWAERARRAVEGGA